jgi:uncharacterized protein
MRARGAFVFPVHDLDGTGQTVDFPVSAAWLRGALEGCEMQPSGPDGRCQVHLTKTGNDVLVQGQLDAPLVVPCARCLGRVELRPHVELTLLLHPAPESARKPEGPDADEADVDTYEGEEVVLDRFLREAILLESPTFPLCSEACEGIRPASESVSHSEDAATDPRLLPLLELAKRRNWKE